MPLSSSEIHQLARLHKKLVLSNWAWPIWFVLVFIGVGESLLTENVVGIASLALLCVQSECLYQVAKKLRYKQLTLIALSPLILPPLSGLYFAHVSAKALKDAGIKTGLRNAT